MLEPIADDVWTRARSLRFFGVETGTKMTIVRLRSGGLFVHSPIALDDSLRGEIAELGPVTAIVAPTRFHHLYVGEWVAAYPDASVSACPGLGQKRADIAWTSVLGDEPEAGWRDELDQVFFGARAMENEVVFFHRKSKTLISSDLMFNLATHPSPLTRAVAFLVGQRAPGPTLLEHLTIRDRVAAREQIARMVAWNAERIVLAHGEDVEKKGAEALRRAYAWL